MTMMMAGTTPAFVSGMDRRRPENELTARRALGMRSAADDFRELMRDSEPARASSLDDMAGGYGRFVAAVALALISVLAVMWAGQSQPGSAESPQIVTAEVDTTSPAPAWLSR